MWVVVDLSGSGPPHLAHALNRVARKLLELPMLSDCRDKGRDTVIFEARHRFWKAERFSRRSVFVGLSACWIDVRGAGVLVGYMHEGYATQIYLSKRRRA